MTPRLVRPLPAVESSYTSGVGYRAWQTKWANQFTDAVRVLSKSNSTTVNTDVLLLAAHEISCQIADLFPPSDVTDLPRDYKLVTRYQQRFLELDGKLFASFGRNLAGREELAKLFEDLQTGLLREIQEVFQNQRAEGSYAR